MEITVSKLILRQWRQFESIELDLSSQITVITGSNGAGKSTVLSILNKHYGFDRTYIGFPKSAAERLISRKSISGRGFSEFIRKIETEPTEIIGRISYSNNSEAHIVAPHQTSTNYGVEIRGQADVSGTHIEPSAPSNLYRGLTDQNFHPPTFESIAQTAHGNAAQLYQGEQEQGRGSFDHLKSSLVKMALFGYGNDAVQPIPELQNAYEEFQEVLRIVLPAEIGFIGFTVDLPEVILITKSGNFLLEGCSGGLIKVILISWQLFLATRRKRSLLVTMDEPENNLHPSMQRSLIPNLVTAFKECKFIIATHSPFIISSSELSKVYAFRFNESISALDARKVVSAEVSDFERAGTASEILREVLGLESTMPKWIDRTYDSIIEKYRFEDPSKETLKKLHEDLMNSGLERKYPNALEAIFK